MWHQGTEFAIRRKDMDRREEIQGDIYEFRAYRIRSDRSVTRFVARPKDGLAAIFIQSAWDNRCRAVLKCRNRNMFCRAVMKAPE